MRSKAEIIGAGALADGTWDPGLPFEHPIPFGRGTPIGQHLRVERLVRVQEHKMLYLLTNVSPLWNKRKCWACGNRYSPNNAQACTYCQTPLRDRRFMLSMRWKQHSFPGFEKFARQRLSHIGMATPSAVRYRDGWLMSVYAYNGESLLIDQPAALPAPTVLRMAIRLSRTLTFLHQHGVVLAPFDAGNVVMQPNDQAVWFDLDVEHLLSGAGEHARDKRRLPLRDVRQLCAMLLRFCDPSQEGLVHFLEEGIDGEFGTPATFGREVERYLELLSGHAVPRNSAAYTDLGLVRSHNEDTWRWRRLGDGATIYVVADGMGGHVAGDVASELASSALVEGLHKAATGKVSEAALVKALGLSFLEANKRVLDLAEKQGKPSGTTLTAALHIGDKVHIAHAGDSRVYLLRGGKLDKLTKDHSLVGLWVESGKISAEEARVHPKSNVLHNYVGQDDEVEVDTSTVPVKKGDRLLLCSDGLWGEMDEPTLLAILLAWPSATECCQELVKATYARGGTDNVTVMVVDI